jgi:hypothetical protein
MKVTWLRITDGRRRREFIAGLGSAAGGGTRTPSGDAGGRVPRREAIDRCTRSIRGVMGSTPTLGGGCGGRSRGPSCLSRRGSLHDGDVEAGRHRSP